jgi:ribosome biogenesis protein SSF1/2
VSSAAGDEGDAVSLASDYVGRNNKRGQKKAIKLEEIGPRMELRLIKITEGLPGKEGGVIYHDIGSCPVFYPVSYVCADIGQLLVKKTKKEVNALKAAAIERERLRKQRREEQERNIEKKKALADEKKGKGNQTEEDEEDEDEGATSNDDIVEEEEGGDDDWDDEEEISEGEEPSESEAESEPEPSRPTKKAKARGHR